MFSVNLDIKRRQFRPKFETTQSILHHFDQFQRKVKNPSIKMTTAALLREEKLYAKREVIILKTYV